MQENINIPDSTITSALTFRNLVLMNMQQLTNFPYIEKDFDALTDYELLCLVVKYLNDVITNQNEQNTSITNMYNAFLQLQTYVNNTKDTLEDAFNNLDDYVRNYFANLDVQEEINNKLDEMLEDGVLEQIIEQFLQLTSLICFDNVQGMKASVNLANGSYARTLGYYAKNDGGSALYKIREILNTDVVDEGLIISLNNNNLIAELIEDIPNVNQFGAKGDGVTDDTTPINHAIAVCSEISFLNKTYKLSEIEINKDIIIHGNYATLIDNSDSQNFISSTIGQRHEIRLDNITLNLQYSEIGIYLQHGRMIADNINIIGASLYGISVNKGNTSGAYGWIELRNSRIENSNTGVLVNATDCHFYNIVTHNCITHYEVNSGLTHLQNIHGWNFNSNSTDWVTGSKLIKAYADIVGSDIYCDTLETCIDLPSVNYKGLIFNNINMFINTSSYPSTQNPPMLFSNLATFESLNSAYCRINGLYINNNNWRDSSSNYAETIPEIKTNRISIFNVGTNAVKTNHFRSIPAFGDIATTEFTSTNTEFLSMGTRKYTLNQYEAHVWLRATLKKNLTSGVEIYNANFSAGTLLNMLNRTARVDAYFMSSSTTGLVYKLDAYVSDSGVLYVYNNTGQTLSSGEVNINIDFYKIVQ